jgi:hypothetical protein
MTPIMPASTSLRARIAAVCFASLILPAISTHAQTNPKAPATIRKEAVMPLHATGSFEVRLTPQDDAIDPTLSRLLLDKQFHGAHEATSKGTMLAAGTAVKGSAGYVAIELVTGTLSGHTGTFVLQHSGTMTRGTPKLSVTVVPDSGTGQLVGLTGTMAINIADGKHSYDFEYTLPEAP